MPGNKNAEQAPGARNKSADRNRLPGMKSYPDEQYHDACQHAVMINTLFVHCEQQKGVVAHPYRKINSTINCD